MKKILFLLFDTKEKNSYIYTEDSIISSFLSPYELIQSWCMDYGSTVEGRTEVIKRRKEQQSPMFPLTAQNN